MAEALKGINISEFNNCVEQRKRSLDGLLHRVESTWKVTEVYTRKNECTIFCKQILGFSRGPPSHTSRSSRSTGKETSL